MFINKFFKRHENPTIEAKWNVTIETALSKYKHALGVFKEMEKDKIESINPIEQLIIMALLESTPRPVAKNSKKKAQ